MPQFPNWDDPQHYYDDDQHGSASLTADPNALVQQTKLRTTSFQRSDGAAAAAIAALVLKKKEKETPRWRAGGAEDQTNADIGEQSWRRRSSPRMQGLAEQMNGEAGLLQRGKQPRPLEDGNWVCDDPSCGNVNYPRRTECNKCGKRRGPLGDAVVKAYIDTIKIARDMGPGSGLAPHLISGDQGGILPRNMMSHMGGAETQQSGMSISPASSHATVGDMEHWMGGGFDTTPLLPSFASHYVTGDGGMSGRRSTLSAATEGKRLAEQLVASFAASTDPVGDAGECLASAALWLQTMKSRLQTSGDPSGGNNSGGPGGLGNLAINSGGPGLAYGNTLGSYLARGNLAGAVGSPSGVRGIMGRPGLRFEDYKDRPSDFLREFGDPAAVNATAMGGGQKPEPGVNGNWECEDCKNVNFPRRTNCFQCHKRRGPKGDEIVRKYVRSLIEDSGSLRT